MVVTYRSAFFTNNHANRLFYRSWVIDQVPSGVVVIVHGINSHSGYFENFARLLTERRYEVLAFDLSGHGRSDGQRLFVKNYKDMISDIDEFVGIANADKPSIPVFLFGHCMGSVLCGIYALLHPNKLKGIISESIPLNLDSSKLFSLMINFLARIVPEMGLIRLPEQHTSRDLETVALIRGDTLLGSRKQPVKTIEQLLSAIKFLKRNLYRMRLPLLILHGTADRIADPSGSFYYYRKSGSRLKEIKLYEGYYHNLVNERYNSMIMTDIFSWLCRNTRSSPKDMG